MFSVFQFSIPLIVELLTPLNAPANEVTPCGNSPTDTTFFGICTTCFCPSLFKDEVNNPAKECYKYFKQNSEAILNIYGDDYITSTTESDICHLFKAILGRNKRVFSLINLLGFILKQRDTFNLTGHYEVLN